MNPSQSLKERIIKGSMLVLLFSLLASPLGYFLRVLYSHTLTIEMYGLFYSAIALFTFLSAYNDLGLSYSVSYLIPKFIKKGDYKSSWNVYKYCQMAELGTSILISIILFFSANYLANFYFKVPEAQNLIYILIIYFISSCFLEGLNNLFTGLQKEAYYSTMQFFRLLLTLIFSVLIWLFDVPNILYFALAFSIANIFICIIYSYLLYNKNNFIVGKTTWDSKLFKTMLSYAIPTLLTTSLYTFITSTDTIFLTLFRGVRDVGVYNIAIPIATILSIFLSPINRFLFPLISNLVEGEKSKVKVLLEEVLKVIPFVGCYFALFIILFPSSTITLLFGSKWVGLVEIPLMIISAGYIISSLSSYLTTFLSAAGYAKERLYASLVIAGINIVLGGLLIYKYGVIGAVVANSIIYFISLVIFGVLLKNIFKFSYPILFYVKLILFSVFLYIVISYLNLNPNSWFEYIFYGIIYTGLFFVFGFYLKVLDKQTIELVFKKT